MHLKLEINEENYTTTEHQPKHEVNVGLYGVKLMTYSLSSHNFFLRKN